MGKAHNPVANIGKHDPPVKVPNLVGFTVTSSSFMTRRVYDLIGRFRFKTVGSVLRDGEWD